MENEYYKKKIRKLELEREEKIASLSPENLKEFRNFERQFNQDQESDNQDKLDTDLNNLRRI